MASADDPPSPLSPRPATSRRPSSRLFTRSSDVPSQEPRAAAVPGTPREAFGRYIRPRFRRGSYYQEPLSGEDLSSVSSSNHSPIRPPSSWVRRMSIRISAQARSNSSTPSSYTDSPNESITPFLPHPQPEVTPPKKLVKRTRSHRGFSNVPAFNTSDGSDSGTDNRPRWRRPATSYNNPLRTRSSTVGGVGSTDLPSRPFTSPRTSPEFAASPREDQPFPDRAGTNIWRPYFQHDSSDAPTIGRSGSARIRKCPLRLIFANTKDPPTLLPPSVISREPENCTRDDGVSNFPVEGFSFQSSSLSEDPESDDSDPTPEAKEPEPILKQDNKHAPEKVPEPEVEPEISPRRSVSARNIRMDATDNPKPVWTSASKTLPARRKHAFSSSGNSESSFKLDRMPHTIGLGKVRSDSLRSKRRNIIDPDIFRRPYPATSAEHDSVKDGIWGATHPRCRTRIRRISTHSELGSAGVGRSVPPSSSGARTPPYYEQESSSAPQTTFPLKITAGRGPRLSLTTSDPASTIIGSDNDRVFSSGDEDDLDFQSDTVFDSFPTRINKGSLPRSRGPRIQDIFAPPNPPDVSWDRNYSGSKLVPEISRLNLDLKALDQNIEDPDLVPVKPESPPPADLFPAKENHTQTATYSDDNDLLWDMDDAEALGIPYNGLKTDTRDSFPVCGLSTPPDTTQRHNSSIIFDRHSARTNSKICLFDWSEQQRVDKDSPESAFRPKTVHGQQGGDEIRGGREPSRRKSGAVHLRSQSVPVAREPSVSLESHHHASGKFGTWGLGNKGVSEDWDGDFDFGDEDGLDGGDVRGSSEGMKVPQAIMERQASVHGQFGHVQELTLLVEELKRLRVRAVALGILDGPSSELWKEAKGIVSLATFEDEEDQQDFSTPPSPVGFGDDLDAELSFDSSHSGNTKVPTSSKTGSRNRHRTESTDKARSVLDSICQHHTPSTNGLSNGSGSGTHKLSFDTQSLRDLVIRAGVVTRALKDMVRKAEGVCTPDESDQRPQTPPLSKVFMQPGTGSPPLRPLASSAGGIDAASSTIEETYTNV